MIFLGNDRIAPPVLTLWIPLVMRSTEQAYATFSAPVPFGLDMDESRQYASDRGTRRFGRISSARGRPLGEIDLDYSQLQLEDTFAAEDEKALATAASAK